MGVLEEKGLQDSPSEQGRLINCNDENSRNHLGFIVEYEHIKIIQLNKNENQSISDCSFPVRILLTFYQPD